VTRLPERIEGERMLLRRWLISDAEAQHRAIVESADHLRPWMDWMAEEPLARPERLALIERWERDWVSGGDVHLGVFVEGAAAGGLGLHRRRCPETVELGYWIHVGFLRQGLATMAARMATDASFAIAGITRVEIHHDRANVASAGVPRRLGFEFVGEEPGRESAPAQVGTDWAWRMERDRWIGAHTSAA
jgi:ribosomal-protein-serine acetyltransferase